MRLDLGYVENWSFVGGIVILRNAGGAADAPAGSAY